MKFPSFFPRLFHPPVYQGKRNPKNYFEGWYYKHVDPTGQHIYSIILGISFSKDPHSFIQIIEGTQCATDYIRFPPEAFSYDRKRLRVSVGENTITHDSISLDLKGEKFTVQGEIIYSEIAAFPQKILAPGIMGWYTYAPFMECYHGVVSMNHRLQGTLKINGHLLDFTGGKGYIEKDWGRSMPSDWIWMQCNHFDKSDHASMMISIARIPWLNGHFPGFLSFIRVGDRIYRFATYNRSKIQNLELEEDYVVITMINPRYMLDVKAKREKSGVLKAPLLGDMNRKIAESLDAVISVKLSERNGTIVFESEGIHAGLEIVEDVSKYIQ